MKIRPVIQLERTGCGIASAAAIAGVPYARAKRIAASLGIHARDQRLWSGTAQVRRLLGRFGARTAAERPFRGWDRLPDLALLSIKWHLEKGEPFWHWVVFVRDERGSRVLDSKKSLKRHVRTDFGRMKPKWYIAVRAAPRRAERSPGASAIRINRITII